MAPKKLEGSSKNDNKGSTFIKSNLKYLRETNGSTLEELSQYLGLGGKSSYRAYEQGDAVPAIHILLKLASFFDVSLDELVRFDLSKTVRESGSNPNAKDPQVAVVPIKARAGYVSGFQDDYFLDGLKKISIPYKPYGIARAFEIDGDSMLPEVSHGSYVVGVKINRNEFQPGKNYIVVTEEGDVLYKNVILNGDELNLISRNPKYPIQRVKAESISEMWRYFCHVDKNREVK